MKSKQLVAFVLLAGLLFPQAVLGQVALSGDSVSTDSPVTIASDSTGACRRSRRVGQAKDQVRLHFDVLALTRGSSMVGGAAGLRAL